MLICQLSWGEDAVGVEDMIKAAYRSKDAETPTTMEAAYINRVELAALGNILYKYYRLKKFKADIKVDGIMPFFKMAMANPLLPPFVEGC